MVCAAPGGHETRGVRGFRCWSALLLEAMLVSICAAPGGQDARGVRGICCLSTLLLEAMLVLVSGLLPGVMLMLMVCLTSRGQMDVCGLGCCLRPC